MYIKFSYPNLLVQESYGERQRGGIPFISHPSRVRNVPRAFFKCNYNKSGSESDSFSKTTWSNHGRETATSPPCLDLILTMLRHAHRAVNIGGCG